MNTMIKVNNRPVVKTWNGLVNELFSDFEQSLGSIHPSFQRNSPAINIVENQEGYHAEVLAPGRSKAHFKVTVENNELLISYEAPELEKPEDLKLVRREFSIENFKRRFVLGEKVEAENIQAKYEDGLLKIFLPKKTEIKPAALNIAVQ